MNILFLAHRLPYPPNKGDKIRSHALFKYLSARHTVHLGCFIDDVADAKYEPQVQKMTRGECHFVELPKWVKFARSVGSFVTGSSITAAVYRDHGMQKWVDRTLRCRRIDAAVIFSSSMAPYLMGRWDEIGRSSVFDMVDLDSDKWAQYGHSTKALGFVYRREAKKLLRLERAAASSFALTYLVSPHEADCFSALAPQVKNRIRALSNGVDLDYFQPAALPVPFAADVTPIVMTGRMDYWPNVDGALWFARNVLPEVRSQIANAVFYVVGAAPQTRLLEIQCSDVKIVGEVPDVRPFIANAGAIVAPLRIARGVQNKVLEALAMGVPTVATEQASRALKVRPGRDLYVANEPSDFAKAVVSAVRGSDNQTLRTNGRLFVERHHDWTSILATLDADLEALVATRDSPTDVAQINRLQTARGPRHESR